MAIIQPTLYILLLLLVYGITGVVCWLHRRSGLFILLLLLPIAGFYFLCTYYLLPLPLNMEGITVYHPKSDILLLPFQTAVSDISRGYLSYYLKDVLPLLSGALLMGVGMPFVRKSNGWLSNTLWCLPFFLFFVLIQILFRVFTGYEGRPLDTTDLCLFLLFQSLGYGLFRLLNRGFPAFKDGAMTRRTAAVLED